MDFGSQAGQQYDVAFSNISATPEACEQRQSLFLRFLNEFQTEIENESDHISSQASGTPGMCASQSPVRKQRSESFQTSPVGKESIRLFIRSIMLGIIGNL